MEHVAEINKGQGARAGERSLGRAQNDNFNSGAFHRSQTQHIPLAHAHHQFRVHQLTGSRQRWSPAAASMGTS